MSTLDTIAGQDSAPPIDEQVMRLLEMAIGDEPADSTRSSNCWLASQRKVLLEQASTDGLLLPRTAHRRIKRS